jgi:hypothetical protein
MKRLRTEGGSRFIVGLVVLFGGAGLYFGWAAVAKGEDTVGAAVALVGMAVVLVLLGRQEVMTDLELRRSRIVVPAKVTAVVRSRTLSVNHTLYRWRLKAEGRLPDGSAMQFISPYILAASKPAVEIGSAVDVNVSPRTGRYRMDLKSLVLAGDGAKDAMRDPEGWRARGFFIAGMVVLTAWIGLAIIDGGNLGYGWVAVPLVACLFLVDMFISFAAVQRRFRSGAVGMWSNPDTPDNDET